VAVCKWEPAEAPVAVVAHAAVPVVARHAVERLEREQEHLQAWLQA
jgi:hypothetical protein